MGIILDGGGLIRCSLCPRLVIIELELDRGLVQCSIAHFNSPDIQD